MVTFLEAVALGLEKMERVSLTMRLYVNVDLNDN